MPRFPLPLPDALTRSPFALGKEGTKVAQPLRVAIFTGGHPFERDAFFAVFDSPEIRWDEFPQPAANELWRGERLRDYDAIALYDLWQEITDEQKQGMVRWLREEGKGLLAIHHSIANYQHWDEYPRIIGARYFLQPDLAPDGTPYERCQVHFDVTFSVRVLDTQHPVTKGLPERFEVVDETYKGFWVSPTVHPLLGTDHELSAPTLAWAHQYGKARVVYLQLGHGPTAYENPHYRRFVHNALFWVAGRI
jgi:type 1 glutamine amidotransferase